MRRGKSTKLTVDKFIEISNSVTEIKENKIPTWAELDELAWKANAKKLLHTTKPIFYICEICGCRWTPKEGEECPVCEKTKADETK